ncbi:hypothetical protein SI65_00222 [Aspergillus cristatus]|uniref:Uncharacterized protein n=1 Tax=Aspergillus cristatus TaxID=573508 RepID=A0A1E3BNU2_ASPCR|nr:hypothetical protein SI65_00222 [Aspergillus cristatus]
MTLLKEEEDGYIRQADHGVFRGQPLSYSREATSWKGSPIPTVGSTSSTALRSLGICRRRTCHSRSLAEIRRILKPGGILPTRDAADQHFYPRSVDLERLDSGITEDEIQQTLLAVGKCVETEPSLYAAIQCEMLA